MTFFLFLLVNATLFLRPAELFPDLAQLPIYETLMISCCIGAFERMKRQLTAESLMRQPITVCVLGLWAAVVLSHLSHFFLYGVRETGVIFLKTVVYYLMFVALVDTPQRLRQLLLTVAGCASLMVALCVIDYVELVDFEFVTHISDSDDDFSETGEEARVLRMRGTGIFQDPNDISLVIVCAGVLCTYFLFDRKAGWRRLVWCAPLAVLATALLCTRSRGGLLAAGAAAITVLMFRYGKTAAIVGGGLAGGIMSLIAGRQANINLGGGTGQERIRMWAEGLDALKSPDILFGIGMGEYADLAGLVAHNSFVHAYVELGFFGGTLFFGCFFFAALALHRLSQTTAGEIDADVARFLPYMAAALAGWATGMLSLSRCYVVPTYLMFGLTTAYLNLASRRRAADRPPIVWNQAWVTRLVAGSAVVLAGLFVFVRVFVRWG